MNYGKCKCGAVESFGSGMVIHDCDGCEKCGTTIAGHPDGHKPLAPVEYVGKYDRNTGVPSYRGCKNCYHHAPLEEPEDPAPWPGALEQAG